MPWLDRPDARLYYETHGEGPALVLAHGIGGNHASWFWQVPVFAASYRVVTFDHRGFGRSEDRGARGRSAFVDDLEALLDELGLERVALVGQSMGGGSCLGLAMRRPARVAALVLADTLHGFAEPPAVAAIMDAVRRETANLDQLERVLGEPFRSGEPALALLYSQLASFNEVDRHTLTGSFGPGIAPAQLASARVPALFIVGEHDRLFPPAAVRLLKNELPSAFLVEIAGAGHSAYFERPAEFNDSVLSFLQAVRYRGRAAPAHSNAPGYRPVGG